MILLYHIFHVYIIETLQINNSSVRTLYSMLIILCLWDDKETYYHHIHLFKLLGKAIRNEWGCSLKSRFVKGVYQLSIWNYFVGEFKSGHFNIKFNFFKFLFRWIVLIFLSVFFSYSCQIFQFLHQTQNGIIQLRFTSAILFYKQIVFSTFTLQPKYEVAACV